MAFVNDALYDAALAVLDSVTVLHICSAQPATYAEATSTYSLGSKATPSIGAVADRTGGGRERVVAAFTDGNVTADGEATHYALVSGTVLYVAGPLTGTVPQRTVGNGNTFSLPAIAVGIPDVA